MPGIFLSVKFNHTRIAPTPSGYLHIGNVLSFAVTYALASRYGADVLLRIDDMDRNRAEPYYISDIFDTLEFLGIEWQHGPRNTSEFQEQYSQLHRLPLYHDALKKLNASGLVYACTCSRAQLKGLVGYPGTCRNKNIPLDTPDVNWRLKTDDISITVNTLSSPIKAVLPVAQRDFVIRKKDGNPAYQLSSVVDDMHFNIDLIVRGEDLWESTLAQLYLAGVLGAKKFQQVVFYHHQLVTGADGSKLSKSAGSTSLHYMRGNKLSRAEVLAMVAKNLNINTQPTSWQELIDPLQSSFS